MITYFIIYVITYVIHGPNRPVKPVLTQGNAKRPPPPNLFLKTNFQKKNSINSIFKKCIFCSCETFCFLTILQFVCHKRNFGV